MQDRPEPGEVVTVAPEIRRILAPNPSPMTFWGTNSYILGTDPVAVIDPGPDDTEHLDGLLGAIDGAQVAAILVTHAHLDHTALVPALAAATGAEVLAFGPPHAGRSPVMQRLAASGLVGGGEGVDVEFRPDRRLGDGDLVRIGHLNVEAIHTPGHFPGHISFATGNVLFSGDHVMDWSTTLISPPEGDVAAFLRSCEKLSRRPERRYLPGHGPPVDAPAERLTWLVAHRKEREAEILAALGQAPGTASELAARVYVGLDPRLLPAASRNVLAHLIDLSDREMVSAQAEIAPDTRFHRI